MIAENGNPVRLFDFLQNYELTEENLPLAFEQVAKYMVSELSHPLEDFAKNIQRGIKRREAFLQLSEALKPVYLDDFALGLEAAERRGGDINRFVAEYGRDYRRSMKNRRKKRLIISDSVKEMAWIIAALFVTAFILTFAAGFPVKYSLLDTSPGRMINMGFAVLSALYFLKLIRFKRLGGGT